VVIDFSCADEVVAKLVMDFGENQDPSGDRFILVRGVRDDHMDPVEGALRRRGLAVAAERASGEPVLLGDVDPGAGEAWRMLCACGRMRAPELAQRLGLEPGPCGRLLADLCRRRLIRRCGDAFESLSFAASGACDMHSPDELRGDDGPASRDG